MKKQVKTARVFTIGFIGEAEVNEGSGDCLTLGVGTLGETVAIIEQYNSPTLNMLRNEMDGNPLGYVNVITLTGESITDKESIEVVWRMAGRQVDIVLRGIFSVRYLDADETKVSIKTTRRGANVHRQAGTLRIRRQHDIPLPLLPQQRHYEARNQRR